MDKTMTVKVVLTDLGTKMDFDGVTSVSVARELGIWRRQMEDYRNGIRFPSEPRVLEELIRRYGALEVSGTMELRMKEEV